MTLDERPTLLAIQHVPWEGPHRILDACGALRVKTVKPLAGQPLPAHEEVAGAVVMGGPMNVDEVERFPALAAEREWLARAVEQGTPVLGICLGAQLLARAHHAGVGTMFRSDHYLSVDDRRERGSLDAWGTITGLGAVTEKLRLGTMVSPATFRHPAVLAKFAVTADHVSGGRVEVGIGAGWWEREHELYGFDLPEIGPRMEALEEQMQVVKGHWGEGPFSFEMDTIISS